LQLYFNLQNPQQKQDRHLHSSHFPYSVI